MAYSDSRSARIMLLALEGKTWNEICEQFGISKDFAEAHVRKFMETLRHSSVLSPEFPPPPFGLGTLQSLRLHAAFWRHQISKLPRKLDAHFADAAAALENAFDAADGIMLFLDAAGHEELSARALRVMSTIRQLKDELASVAAQVAIKRAGLDTAP